NDIHLDDHDVSPTHANLLRKSTGYQINLLDRSKKIYLNGEVVRRGLLKYGDRVKLGRFELTLMEGSPPKEEQRKELETLERLVQFSAKLMEETNPSALFERLLEDVVLLTAAEKGFIIVIKDGTRHLAASHNIKSSVSSLSKVSDTIVDRVIESKEPLIVSNALSDQTFRQAQSVIDLKISSVMCVPLVYRKDLLGVIYLGNDAITGLFEQKTLKILTVWSSQAALILHTALMLNELQISNKNLREQLNQTGQGKIIGSCTPMKKVFHLIKRLAPTDLSILILGETGTGKELVAKELHEQSDRKKKPFISINCGAIPENLLESELFGHKKGAFTGAVTDKIGKFEAAHGGTIFLDEIGEMPMNLQVKLLRVLQERKIERVGELKARQIDIRVISATNKNLEDEIKEGRFREDLFYRLAEVTIQLPPLRERGTDIHDLALFFLNKYGEQYASDAKGFSSGAIQAMLSYYWPGNVRQLESRIKKASIMSENSMLSAEDIGIAGVETKDFRPLDLATEDFKQSYIKEALEIHNWNKAKTARALGVDPRTIFRYIEKFHKD
ncbi:MAG: sigma 54-interacting transcriptional regulator, partial [Myxococcota bacterium]|nr:sigma 54-interacting transcriptional regulator [Myxococcota bacterium]